MQMATASGLRRDSRNYLGNTSCIPFLDVGETVFFEFCEPKLSILRESSSTPLMQAYGVQATKRMMLYHSSLLHR
jgi:hypothetical protein